MPLNGLIVYIFDSSDVPHSEGYDTRRSALVQRDPRIREVAFVHHQGMMPLRNDLAPWT